MSIQNEKDLHNLDNYHFVGILQVLGKKLFTKFVCDLVDQLQIK